MPRTAAGGCDVRRGGIKPVDSADNQEDLEGAPACRDYVSGQHGVAQKEPVERCLQHVCHQWKAETNHLTHHPPVCA